MVRSLRNASSACDPPLNVASRLAPDTRGIAASTSESTDASSSARVRKEPERFSATNASPAAATPPSRSAMTMTCSTPRLAFMACRAGVTSEMEPARTSRPAW